MDVTAGGGSVLKSSTRTAWRTASNASASRAL